MVPEAVNDLLPAHHRPDGHHDDDDRDQLQHNPRLHQVLRAPGIAAAYHVDEAQYEDRRDGRHRDRHQNLAQELCHAECLSLALPDQSG